VKIFLRQKSWVLGLGLVKIKFNENFYKKYPILWVFRYGYGYGYWYSISWILGVEYGLDI
jgi:hypothetical protein